MNKLMKGVTLVSLLGLGPILANDISTTKKITNYFYCTLVRNDDPISLKVNVFIDRDLDTSRIQTALYNTLGLFSQDFNIHFNYNINYADINNHNQVRDILRTQEESNFTLIFPQMDLPYLGIASLMRNFAIITPREYFSEDIITHEIMHLFYCSHVKNKECIMYESATKQPRRICRESRETVIKYRNRIW